MGLSIHAPPPLHIFKHGSQGLYNGRKPGVDKSTELAMLINLINSKLCFKTKYVLRMIDAVLCNAWRAHQAVHVALPFIEEEEGQSRTAEIGKVRKKLNNDGTTLQDFTQDLCISILQTITLKKYSNQQTNATAAAGTVPTEVRADDVEVTSIIARLKDEGVLPVLRNR